MLYPVPVHTVPLDIDPLLYSEHTRCSRLEFPKQHWNKVIGKVIYKDNRDLFEYISYHTGRYVTTVQDLCEVNDALYVEH